MRTRLRAATLLAATAILAGCSGELVGGGARDVDAYATGDGTSGGSASLSPRYTVSPGGGAAFQSNGISGTITFDARVSLVSGGARHPVGGSSSTFLSINGRDTAHIATGEVPGVAFPTARVVFTRVTANVSGGLLIGGAGFTGEVNVPIADSIVVERPVSIPAGDGPIELLVDLDASAWLAATNPLTRTVAAAVFQGAVKVRAN